MNTTRIIVGDALKSLRQLEANSIHCCVTSPPYWGLRDYGCEGQIGLEPTFEEFLAKLLAVFAEVRRVLRPDGVMWVNMGDSYTTDAWGGGVGDKSTISGSQQHAHRAALQARTAPRLPYGLPPKNVIGQPWRLAFALQEQGWILRDPIVWAKPNGMPGSQKDRCTSSYEMIFQLSKSEVYWSDFDAIKTPPRESSLVRLTQDIQAQAGSHRANGGADAMEKSTQQSAPAMMRNVWFVSPEGFNEAHFAVMPQEIARRCILAGCPDGDTVLDPFGGAGTTGLVANRLGRDAILLELNPAYAEMAAARINADQPMYFRADVTRSKAATSAQQKNSSALLSDPICVETTHGAEMNPAPRNTIGPGRPVSSDPQPTSTKGEP